MNKKVFVSMLSLTVFFLSVMYIAKMFFPEQFVMALQNERLCEIGQFIDSHILIYYVCCFATSFLAYWLFCCAASRRKYLNWKECLIILACVVGSRIIDFIDPNIATHVHISLFFILPLIAGAKLKETAIIYFVHGLSQVLSLSIRNLPMYLANVNFITAFFMAIETYLWLVLFYIIYNYKDTRKDNQYGSHSSSVLRNRDYYEED